MVVEGSYFYDVSSCLQGDNLNAMCAANVLQQKGPCSHIGQSIRTINHTCATPVDFQPSIFLILSVTVKYIQVSHHPSEIINKLLTLYH